MEICLIDEAQRGKLERGEDSQVTCVNSHRATSDLNDADFFKRKQYYSFIFHDVQITEDVLWLVLFPLWPHKPKNIVVV